MPIHPTQRSMSLGFSLALALVACVEAYLLQPAIAGPGRHDERHTSPKLLVLRFADLPKSLGKGFTQLSYPVGNSFVAQEDHVSVSAMNRYRITGYHTEWLRRSTKGGNGTVQISDTVSLFKSASAAAWEYQKFTRQDQPAPGSKTVSMNGIGDQARGFSLPTRVGNQVNLYFRRGTYSARLETLGVGKVDALRLARILDGRMRKAE